GRPRSAESVWVLLLSFAKMRGVQLLLQSEHRAIRMAEDLFRDAAHEDAAQPRASVGGHDDQTDGSFAGNLSDLARGISLKEKMLQGNLGSGRRDLAVELLQQALAITFRLKLRGGFPE